MLCGRALATCLDEIEKFHGFIAPGIVLGGFMVDWARELIDEKVEADAIVETQHCLPDAVQLFSPCTVGNGWMKILDWDKFALSFYDRKNLTGYRVWLDLHKARSFPNLYDWYMRLVPKKSLPIANILDDILTAQRSVLCSCAITITRFYERQKKGEIRVCPSCSEAYAASQGTLCFDCQGKGYFHETPEQPDCQLFHAVVG